MTSVSFDHVDLSVDGQVVLRDLVLDVADGEFVGVIGPSGSGKTTFLRGIAGFASVSRGALRFDDADVSSVPVARRGIGMVFQSPTLFTNRSVRDNVAFPLELARRQIEEIRERVGAEARALHLEHLLERRPDELSRGEEQLVQIARTMVKAPRVLLLDEPLASLDEVTRERMRVELGLLQAGYGVTTFMTTNDPVDATRMPDRLVVLHDGRMVQSGTVDDVRHAPANVDAAMTTGGGALLAVTVTHGGDGMWLARRDADPDGASWSIRAWGASLVDRRGDTLLMLVRDGDVVADDGRAAHDGSTATVRAVRPVPGPGRRWWCEVGAAAVLVDLASSATPSPGDLVAVRVVRHLLFDPATSLAIDG